jgi:hypothetical protein
MQIEPTSQVNAGLLSTELPLPSAQRTVTVDEEVAFAAQASATVADNGKEYTMEDVRRVQQQSILFNIINDNQEQRQKLKEVIEEQ